MPLPLTPLPMACVKYSDQSSPVKSCQVSARNTLVTSQRVQSYSQISMRDLLYLLHPFYSQALFLVALLLDHSAITTSNNLLIKNNRLTPFWRICASCLCNWNVSCNIYMTSSPPSAFYSNANSLVNSSKATMFKWGTHPYSPFDCFVFLFIAYSYLIFFVHDGKEFVSL